MVNFFSAGTEVEEVEQVVMVNGWHLFATVHLVFDVKPLLPLFADAWPLDIRFGEPIVGFGDLILPTVHFFISPQCELLVCRLVFRSRRGSG